MTVPIVHPRFLDVVGVGFFPSLATIQVKSVTLDDYGQEVETWANVVGMVDVACAKAPPQGLRGAIEQQRASYTTTDQIWEVLLQGAYPTITTRHRAVVDGATYDIDAVETDQTGTVTRLRVRTVGT